MEVTRMAKYDPIEEEAPVEDEIEESKPITDLDPAEPAPAVLAPQVDPWQHGQIIETVWSGFPNFECSACPFATLDREAAEEHVNRKIDH
jgi:hypothetical protein